MSLNDLILEILGKKPMLGTAGINDELKRRGEERHPRTIQRHLKKLEEAHKITIGAYDRKKRRPLYIVRDEDEEYKSIMSLPEISEVDWSRIPKSEILRIHELWRIRQEYGLTWLKEDLIRLILKSYTKNGDSKSLKEKINELFTSIKKLDVFWRKKKLGFL